MAPTVQHSHVEQMRINQAITCANLAQASAAIAAVADESKKTHMWRQHVDFGLEDEVNKAMQTALEATGYTNVEVLEFFKAIKGLDGKDEYSFDRVLEATKGEESCLFVGETKQYLEGDDVRDAEADRRKLQDRLVGVQLDQSKIWCKVIQQPN